MRTPPFLVGAALLFWGWQTELLPLALIVALVLESSRWVKLRLELEQDHFNRIWNLCTLLFIGTAMYVFFAKGGFGAVNELIQTESMGVRSSSLKRVSSSAMIFVQWLPMVYVPFMIALAYSHTEKVPGTTFSLYYQARKARNKHHNLRHLENMEIDPSYPFLIMILLAASATVTNKQWYFPCMAVLILWSIWPFRNTRFTPATWASVFVLTALMAFGGQLGLTVVQQKLELLQNHLMNQFGRAVEFDTQETQTAIGSIGKIHQSNRIVLRVSTDGSSPPSLLRESAFNQFVHSNKTPFWTAANTNRELQIVVPLKKNSTWALNQSATPRNTVSVRRYTVRGEINLALPNGTILIDELDAMTIKTNRLGAARTIDALKIATYDVRYADAGGFSVDPEIADRDTRQLNETDQTAVDQISQQLKLRTLTQDQALTAIRAFFLSEFNYSTYQQSQSIFTNNSPLASFLLEHHTGHCEYFATASVHLLRAAGIPARYVVGYSVQEKTGENQWIVRSRHAHAWALAWINERWQEVDNTPANWNSIEEQNAGFWEPIKDWFSNTWMAFNQWRQGDSEMQVYVFAAGVVVLGFMAWRQISGKRWRRSKRGNGNRNGNSFPGMDSDFYLIEKKLTAQLAARGEAEPMGFWIDRIQIEQPDLAGQLSQLIELHYRLRFDPTGLSATDRNQLKNGVHKWLEEYEQLLRSNAYKN